MYIFFAIIFICYVYVLFVQENFQKQLFPMALRLPRTRPNLGETDKNRVKPLHFLTRGRVGGVRSKKNSYSHA